ncbi:hypothetical protein ACFY12_20725 [Streptomyces sp. NPDC001339]|uniref:hypothetical protein n=1 Tax=Streptomyces sp. NPDC001339 TaxID=3364563 RepID=UPI0036989FAE
MPKLALIKRSMRRLTKMRTSKKAIVAAGVTVHYVVSEIIDGAHVLAEAEGGKRILPKHISGAVANDSELAAADHPWFIRSGEAAARSKSLGGPGEAVAPAAPQETGTQAGNPRKHSALLGAHQYEAFVKRLLKARQGQAATSSVRVLNDIASDLVARIAETAAGLALKAGKQTIGADDVQIAVDILLKGELRRAALCEVAEALHAAAHHHTAAAAAGKTQ